MNREEILAKSRKENKGNDERELAAQARAGQIASAVGVLICAVILVTEGVFSDYNSRVVSAIWAVYLTITGTTLLVKCIKLKKRHEMFFGVLQLIAAAMFFTMYIIRLVG